MSPAELEPLAVLAAGTVFNGRYEIVRAIRIGGMGAVYEVIHLETRRRSALKVMLPSFTRDPELRARFRREATVVADVQSEHLAEVFDAGVDEDTELPFLVMELLRGEDLGVTLARQSRLLPKQVVTLLHQAALLLDKTHALGIVHRDLKPENLFLTARDDGSLRLRVLDFGIAKVVASGTHPQTTRNFGTPLYMSPEQIRGDGDIGPGADIWALGQVAFALLTGKPYWASEATADGGMYSVLLHASGGLPESATTRALKLGAPLPSAFDAWFASATALAPADRFETASEAIEALAAALGVADWAPLLPAAALLPAASDGRPASAPARSSSKWLTVLLAMVLGALIASVALWFAQRSRSSLATSSASGAVAARLPDSAGAATPAAPAAPDAPDAPDATEPRLPSAEPAAPPSPFGAASASASSASQPAPPTKRAFGKAPPPAASQGKGPGARSISARDSRYDPTDLR